MAVKHLPPLPLLQLVELRPIHTMRLVVHNRFQIHCFLNYRFGFSIIIQKNRMIQIAFACIGLSEDHVIQKVSNAFDTGVERFNYWRYEGTVAQG